MTTTTLELPRNLRFTVGDHPRPILVETRLDQIANRQRVGLLRDGLAALAIAGFAIVLACGLVGI